MGLSYSDHLLTQLSLSTLQSGEVLILPLPQYAVETFLNALKCLPIQIYILLYLYVTFGDTSQHFKCCCSILKCCEVSPNPNIYTTILICYLWETLRSILKCCCSILKCCEVSPKPNIYTMIRTLLLLIGRLIMTVG